MRISTICPMVGVCAWWVVPIAQAEIRTFAMEGTVSYIDDPLNMLDWVNVGSERMVYTFSFDSETLDKNSAPNIGEYDALSASLIVGDTPIAVSAPIIQISHPLDAFRLRSELTFLSYSGAAILTLADQLDNNALTDTMLPTVPYGLEPWELKYFGIGIDIPQPEYPYVVTIGFGGDIDSFYIVPEPASALLLVLGLIVLSRRNS